MKSFRFKLRPLLLLLILAVVSIVWFGWSAYRFKMIGPSAVEAFQWYIKDPIPNSVTDLKLKYSPHMRGYWIWLSEPLPGTANRKMAVPHRP